MHKALWRSLAVVLIMGLLAPHGVAQEAQTKGGPSDRAVRVLVSYTWQTMPKEIQKPDGSMVTVDGQDVDKFMIPMEDARRVVMIANRTADAQLCDLPRHQVANHRTLMKKETASKRWSDEQLAFIHMLHLVTVGTRTADRIEAREGGVAQGDASDAEKAEMEEIVKRRQRYDCEDEKRERVRLEIESFVGHPPKP